MKEFHINGLLRKPWKILQI